MVMAIVWMAMIRNAAIRMANPAVRHMGVIMMMLIHSQLGYGALSEQGLVFLT